MNGTPNVIRRAARCYSENGLLGLMQRAMLGPQSSRFGEERRQPKSLRLKEEQRKFEADRLLENTQQIYSGNVRAFTERCDALGKTGLEHFYWYHTIDLGNGLVTPGDYDYRGQLGAFHFPEDMTGMRALDVGSATGFFAFEFERRGAEVTSVELPSLEDWDILTCDRAEVRRKLVEFFHAATPEEAYFRHLEGPFQFCKQALSSKVERHHSTIYNLSPAKLGKYDLVYAGDILLHLFSPLAALDALSQLSSRYLIMTLDMPHDEPVSSVPTMKYLGLANLKTDNRTWWQINCACAMEMLQRLGFRTVREVGRYSGRVSRDWHTYDRRVIFASRD